VRVPRSPPLGRFSLHEIGVGLVIVCLLIKVVSIPSFGSPSLDSQLRHVLRAAGFTGRIEERLKERLGRSLDPDLISLGRDLFFDKILSLANDTTCASCHAPSAGFGDTQSIAIGVGAQSDLVGPHRKGPRNQRRAPTLLNSAFFPVLTWNGRFAASSGDPFDRKTDFLFPWPEGRGFLRHRKRFGAEEARGYHLLVAQAHMPPTELSEMAGFHFGQTLTFRESRLGGRVRQDGRVAEGHKESFSGVRPDLLPQPVAEFFNEPIRERLLLRLNHDVTYRERFAAVYPVVGEGGAITFEMIGQAIAEFEFSLTFADAPLDRFARGAMHAMTSSEKRGALLFFGKARCVECHRVAGKANEMFSDFAMHVIGVPQIAPRNPTIGGTSGNVPFSGPGNNEDFGLEDLTGREVDRYRFRTSPLRNVALQPTFGHNGAWTRLEDVIAHHLDPVKSARAYDPAAAGVASDLHTQGPIDAVLARLSPKLARSSSLTPPEFKDLVAFVRSGLLDPSAHSAVLCKLVPARVPSGTPVQRFEGC
jgi:cytochrome c peroxidase